jgi:hypothetical protein
MERKGYMLVIAPPDVDDVFGDGTLVSVYKAVIPRKLPEHRKQMDTDIFDQMETAAPCCTYLTHDGKDYIRASTICRLAFVVEMVVGDYEHVYESNGQKYVTKIQYVTEEAGETCTRGEIKARATFMMRTVTREDGDGTVKDIVKTRREIEIF